MGRPSYVCTVCSEHFTRKYSAKRHNQNIHNGVGEIVRLIDYLAGRSSGQYMPDNPFWQLPSSHASLVSHPDEIAKLILDAAKAVTTKK